MKYNIPQSILDKVKWLMGLEDDDFTGYLEGLEQEAKAYIKGLLYVDIDTLDEETVSIMVSFYMQYALYSKIEKEEISKDKLDFLISYIDGYNSRLEKLDNGKIRKPGEGVTFL